MEVSFLSGNFCHAAPWWGWCVQPLASPLVCARSFSQNSHAMSCYYSVCQWRIEGLDRWRKLGRREDVPVCVCVDSKIWPLNQKMWISWCLSEGSEKSMCPGGLTQEPGWLEHPAVSAGSLDGLLPSRGIWKQHVLQEEAILSHQNAGFCAFTSMCSDIGYLRLIRVLREVLWSLLIETEKTMVKLHLLGGSYASGGDGEPHD